MLIYDYLSILIFLIAIFFLFERKKKQLQVGAVALLLTLFSSLLLSLFTQFALQRNLLVVTGYLSFLFLAAVLLIGPMLRLFNKQPIAKLMPYRRDLGVTSFIFALGHILLAYSNYFAWNFSIFLMHLGNSGEVSIAIYAGLIAAVALLILSLLSNKPSLRKLGTKNWKNIQRASYLIGILIVLHTVFFGSLYKRFFVLQFLFLGITLIVAVFQIAGFITTKRRRG